RPCPALNRVEKLLPSSSEKARRNRRDDVREGRQQGRCERPRSSRRRNRWKREHGPWGVRQGITPGARTAGKDACLVRSCKFVRDINVTRSKQPQRRFQWMKAPLPNSPLSG